MENCPNLYRRRRLYNCRHLCVDLFQNPRISLEMLSLRRCLLFVFISLGLSSLFHVNVPRHEQDPLQEISALSIMSEPGHPNVLQKVAALDDGEYVSSRCIPPLCKNVWGPELIIRGAIFKRGTVHNFPRCNLLELVVLY